MVCSLKGGPAIFDSKKHTQQLTEAPTPSAGVTPGNKQAPSEPTPKGLPASSQQTSGGDDTAETTIDRALAFGRKLRAQTLQAVSHPLSGTPRQDHDEAAEEDPLSQLSHDLRTPLTSIRSFSEILVNHPDLSARQRTHYLRIILEECERLEALLKKQGA